MPIRTKDPRRLTFVCLFLALAIGLMLLWHNDRGAVQTTTDDTVLASSEGVLRLHIRANSDEAADQTVKLAVRDALLPLFYEAASYEDARDWVLHNGDVLQSCCESTLREAGFGYGATLYLGETDFPTRSYNGVCYPAGRYDALVVELGTGSGHNWWCVLFPPLCLVTKDGELPEDLEENGELYFESEVWEWIKRNWAALFGEET